MRHSTPDLTIRRSGKARGERLVELAESVGEIARAGMGNEAKCAIGVHQKAASGASDGKIKRFMVGATGFEPVTSTV